MHRRIPHTARSSRASAHASAYARRVHLVFYTQNILDLGSFSTGVSWLIVIGGCYGGLRLALDVVAFAWRRNPLRGWHFEDGHGN